MQLQTTIHYIYYIIEEALHFVNEIFENLLKYIEQYTQIFMESYDFILVFLLNRDVRQH